MDSRPVSFSGDCGKPCVAPFTSSCSFGKWFADTVFHVSSFQFPLWGVICHWQGNRPGLAGNRGNGLGSTILAGWRFNPDFKAWRICFTPCDSIGDCAEFCFLASSTPWLVMAERDGITGWPQRTAGIVAPNARNAISVCPNHVLHCSFPFPQWVWHDCQDLLPVMGNHLRNHEISSLLRVWILTPDFIVGLHSTIRAESFASIAIALPCCIANLFIAPFHVLHL